MPQSALIYSFYGDDFTGSTDVLENVAGAGLRSVLFLGEPSAEHLQRFSDCQVIGIAGDSRSRTPTWMDENLPRIFALLRSFDAPVTHYKVCSTFDSAPSRGSIGRAMEIGLSVFAPEFVPIVVGAPHLRRYVVFGNLFAAAGDNIYRIDRHPTMSCHPVTPMREADLRRHLALQTAMPIGLIDLQTLQAGKSDGVLTGQIAEGRNAILFDGIDRQMLSEIGRVLSLGARRKHLFTVGSSGLTQALISQWQADGLIPDTAPSVRPSAVDSLLVVSGSCSPVTAGQIHWAAAHGFESIVLDPQRLIHAADVAMEQYSRAVIAMLRRSRKVVLYTALGPLAMDTPSLGDALGQKVGRLLRDVILHSGVRRVLLAGGDTSSHAVAQLGLHALTWAGDLQPGAPLCRGHSDDAALDGLELVLKGGQIGSEDFFERVLLGTG